ncbi:MAG: HNH endonuclease [Treponema sp.]|nr:HNH endonuclease [Treponema sp.]
MAEPNSDKIAIFQEEKPSLQSYWRSVILFGKNTASYKFSLANALLDFAKRGKSEVTLKQIAEPFAENICRHIEKSPRQATNPTCSFLEACTSFNKGELSKDELINNTVKNGFRYVFDAFHNVNGGQLPVKFYEKTGNKLILTDELFKLNESPKSQDLILENEARWNLVETAWQMSIAQLMMHVQFNKVDETFFIKHTQERISLTPARNALNGYQKGKCFYCYADITVSSKLDNCDVDHFFPFALREQVPKLNINGLWNLVLACPECNRGIGGKFAQVPSLKYLERLHKRNEFLISSHHPIRETLISEMGATETDRKNFLQEVDRLAINCLIHRWETPIRGEPSF